MPFIDEDVVAVAVEGPVTEIVINRPKALNALNADVLASLILKVEAALRRDNLRVIIITGAGDRSFVAGADVAQMSQLGPRPIADYVELGQRAMRTLENARVPVIAAVNGFALGGGLELALACDIIIAANTAKVGQPEVNLGIIPGFGGTQRLMARCGVGTTRRLVLTGEIIGAAEALQLGIIDKVVEPAELLLHARTMGELIASKAPLAIEGGKAVLRKATDAQLLSGLRQEVETFLALFATADREEGMGAFLQKREPKFLRK